MSTVSIPKKCALCGIGELTEFGHTALPKFDPATNVTDHSKNLITRIFVCSHCGHLTLFAGS